MVGRENLMITHGFSQALGRQVCFPRDSMYHLSVPALEQYQDLDFWQQCLHNLRNQSPAWPWQGLKLAQRLSYEDLAQAGAQHMRALQALGGTYIDFASALYPPLLRHIHSPPAGVSILGNAEVLRKPQVALVGSRQGSAWSLEMAQAISVWLVTQGYSVVSGGALGCDIAAHQASLLAPVNRASTVVVLASGLKQWYPRHNIATFEAILAAGGVLLSERYMDAVSRPYDFPIRNRLITGMAEALVVLQADLRSGSYKTAKQALDQGRDVYVLAHEPYDIRASGSRQLLLDGAIGFKRWQDFAELWSQRARVSAWTSGSTTVQSSPCSGLLTDIF